MMSRTQHIILIYGILFIAGGILGFFENPIFGLFQVDPIHNSVHLISGIVALISAIEFRSSRWFARVFGVIYGIVSAIGLIDGATIFGIFMTNNADNLLHVILSLPLLYLGFAYDERTYHRREQVRATS
jgi:hypothetical protein